MAWRLQIARQVEKRLRKFPAKDQQRLVAALGSMRQDPFTGDIVRLKGELAGWRRRVGDYRIFFDVRATDLIVDVVDIVRRTSTTY